MNTEWYYYLKVIGLTINFGAICDRLTLVWKLLDTTQCPAAVSYHGNTHRPIDSLTLASNH